MTKVLVVEDNKIDRALLSEMLAFKKYVVAEASNGIEALKSVKSSKPDIIISDVMMPVMDGFTLLRELKKDESTKHIPLIFYSAHYVGEKDKELALKLGASGFVFKPIEFKELINKIESLLGEYETGLVKPEEPSFKTEEEYLKQYSERIIRKLEEKVVELEQETVERKWAFEELGRALNERENFMETIPGIVCAADINGNLIRWNRKLMEVTGLKGKEIMGKPVLELFADQDKAIMTGAIGKVLKEGYAEVEAKMLGKNGILIPYHVTVTALKDENCNLMGLIGVGIDITERKKRGGIAN